jgi:Family of unknown function (DUF6516)
MNTIEEYFTAVCQLLQNVPQANAERYEEQILLGNRGNQRIRLRFTDQALLEISEAPVIVAGKPQWLSYRYHYQDSSMGLVFRYDDAPHHPEVPTHPAHKHVGDDVLASPHPSIEQVLQEVQTFR